MELNLSEITSLYYHGIQYLIEAYKIFYGQLPNLENMENEIESRKRIQIMTLILSEYDVLNGQYNDYRYIGFNDYLGIPYSTAVDFKFNFLIEKLRNVNNKNFELEQLYIKRPLSEKEKEGIKAISYVIQKQIEKEKIEDPIEFLKQLCNILYSRDNLIFNYDAKLKAKLTKTMDYVVHRHQLLKYSNEMVIEKLNFVCRKLCLYIDRTHQNCNLTRVIMEAMQNGMDEYESYSGLLINQKLVQKPKKLIKYMEM